MTKHGHAEKMMQYAQDAMETHTPWERWEWQCMGHSGWLKLNGNPVWDVTNLYRRKKQRIVLEETDEFRSVKTHEYYMYEGRVAQWKHISNSLCEYQVWRIVNE